MISWFDKSRGVTRWLVFSSWILTTALAIHAHGESYVVRRNDTLFGIARRFGVSPARLSDANDLSKNAWVYVGQRLTIPKKTKQAPAAPDNPTLAPSMRKAIARTRVKPGRWKYIVIHHSGVGEGTVKGMDRYHREVRHMKNGLAYHFVIGNGHGMRDGEVAAGPRWRKQLDGGHLASEAQNKISLGICLVGNFDKTRPTARQMRSLTALVEALFKRCHLNPDAVKTHQEINVVGTRCPGRHFPIEAFRRELQHDQKKSESSRGA